MAALVDASYENGDAAHQNSATSLTTAQVPRTLNDPTKADHLTPSNIGQSPSRLR
jgi:hypothetical protein